MWLRLINIWLLWSARFLFQNWSHSAAYFFIWKCNKYLSWKPCKLCWYRCFFLNCFSDSEPNKTHCKMIGHEVHNCSKLNSVNLNAGTSKTMQNAPAGHQMLWQLVAFILTSLMLIFIHRALVLLQLTNHPPVAHPIWTMLPRLLVQR